ncbi:dynein regulatory complex subunit 3-like [Tubulanus polymorphus]|uniref:dynein regulatory complex subunit 3-like n=1 Tax=Tubulanus polymorphus TaxID=672921 RepID=UPI003DA52E7C
MSRLYDTVEPSVIDEDMLQKAVEEQGPKDEAGRIAKSEGIDFTDVTSLRLDFKNILKIDNLWCFTNLTKLQLDNNIIEKIEGLDKLVNLVWLDLSFNNIESLEGFDKLTRLEDLTLFNNRISKVENLSELKCLQILSLGNNELKELENLVSLRAFKNLKTLNLAGNPICDLPEYKIYTVAHIPWLEYLDYRLVDENSKMAGYEKYQIAIEELIHDENAAERKLEELKLKEEEVVLHKAAYVEYLNGPYLFDSLFAEDAEGQKLNTMPGVDESLITYKEKFIAICQQIFEFGLEEHEKRISEYQQYQDSCYEAKTKNKTEGMNIIDKFMTNKKLLFQEFHHLNDQQMIDKKIAEYLDEVKEIHRELLELDVQLADQLEDTNKDFERNMQEMVTNFIENVQGQISQCRELENIHHERLLELAIVVLEKVVKNELEEEISEDLRMLFVDKDTIVNAVTASHDVHLLKIDNREDELVTRIKQWSQNIIDENLSNEISRSRARGLEICNLTDHLRDEIDSFDLQGSAY